MRISDWSSDVCSSDLAELHRRQRDAALQHRRACVEGADGFAPRLVVAVGLQARDDLGRDVVLDLLVVGGDVAARPVEIPLADVQWVLDEGEGDLLDDALATVERKSTRLNSSN